MDTKLQIYISLLFLIPIHTYSVYSAVANSSESNSYVLINADVVYEGVCVSVCEQRM